MKYNLPFPAASSSRVDSGLPVDWARVVVWLACPPEIVAEASATVRTSTYKNLDDLAYDRRSFPTRTYRRSQRRGLLWIDSNNWWI
jgi:hypothetical protein